MHCLFTSLFTYHVKSVESGQGSSKSCFPSVKGRYCLKKTSESSHDVILTSKASHMLWAQKAAKIYINALFSRFLIRNSYVDLQIARDEGHACGESRANTG